MTKIIHRIKIIYTIFFTLIFVYLIFKLVGIFMDAYEAADALLSLNMPDIIVQGRFREMLSELNYMDLWGSSQSYANICANVMIFYFGPLFSIFIINFIIFGKFKYFVKSDN